MRQLNFLWTFAFIIHASFTVKSQTNDIPANMVQTATRPNSFEEYLVQLAYNNSPELEGAKYEIDARTQEIGIAKKEWMRNIQGGLNFNEVSVPYFVKYSLGIDSIAHRAIDTTRFSRITTYPLWNIGIGVNVGDLVTRKYKVRFAEQKKKISETEMTFRKQRLRAEVLKRYQEFLTTFEVLKVRLQALDVAEANRLQLSNLFTLNKARFEDYNLSTKTFFDSQEAKVKADADTRIKKIALEELIGLRWETLERIKSSYEDRDKK